MLSAFTLQSYFYLINDLRIFRTKQILFLAGVSPLASVMDLTTKLRLAFEVFDYNETGTISRDNMESVIGG